MPKRAAGVERAFQCKNAICGVFGGLATSQLHVTGFPAQADPSQGAVARGSVYQL